MLGEDKEKLIEAQINAPPLMLEDKDKAAQVNIILYSYIYPIIIYFLFGKSNFSKFYFYS